MTSITRKSCDTESRIERPIGPISVVVAEDDSRMRSALGRILTEETGFDLVGEAADGRQAIELCLRRHPDIVLMDIKMPRMTGIEATRQLSRLLPTTKVIALTAHPSVDYVLPMIRSGASGYLLKDFSKKELLDAMRGVLDDDERFAVAPSLVGLLAEYAVKDRSGLAAEVLLPAGVVELTAREIEVVTWLAQGLSNRAIAQRMYLSEASVKTYLNHVTTKLGVSDRVQVLIRCYELGLVNPSLAETTRGLTSGLNADLEW